MTKAYGQGGAPDGAAPGAFGGEGAAGSGAEEPSVEEVD